MSYKHFLGSGHVLVGFYFTDQRSTVHPSGGSLTALLLLEPDEAVYLLVPEKTNGVCHGTPKSRACYDSFLITPLSRRLAQAWQTETSLSAQTFPNWHDPAIPKALWKYFQQLTSRACSHNMLIRPRVSFQVLPHTSFAPWFPRNFTSVGHPQRHAGSPVGFARGCRLYVCFPRADTPTLFASPVALRLEGRFPSFAESSLIPWWTSSFRNQINFKKALRKLYRVVPVDE